MWLKFVANPPKLIFDIARLLHGKRSPTFTIDADQFFRVKGNAAKLKAGLTVLGSQDRIFRPWIGKELTVRLIMAVCKTDAARIEEEKLAVAAYLLGVGMAASQDMISIRAEVFLEFFFRRSGQDDVVK